MRRPRNTRPLAAALPVLVVAALLAGCGSDDDEGGSGATTAPTVAATTPATTSTTESTPAAEGTALAEPTESASGEATASAEAPDDDITTVDVTITDGEVSPKPGRVEVEEGDTVAITVTSDVADELHVHGYDVSADLPAGKPGTVQFEADEAGLFEVETHDSHLLLFQLLVR